MSPALNGSTALQRFKRGRNTQRNNVQFLPGTATYSNALHSYPALQCSLITCHVPV